MRREFLQLAKVYKDQNIAGWYVSEKLDGTRCLWDGGITRGLRTKDVPWANVVDPKTGEPKRKVKPSATGLWSRYGNPIMAPDWFLDRLPNFPLDGELWAGRGNFQLCRSICAGDAPDPRFDKITYMAYGAPPIDQLFGDGLVKNPQFHLEFKGICEWAISRASQPIARMKTFADEYRLLQRCGTGAFPHIQVALSEDIEEARAKVEEFLQEVLDLGGEGVVIRDPKAMWTPKRVGSLLKYKPFLDDEAIVVGFTAGKGKYLGMIGALILDYRGKQLELSGLTDAEREFKTQGMIDHARIHPGDDMPSDYVGKYFRQGQKVTFKYRELSDGGIPKEARYWRRRDVE